MKYASSTPASEPAKEHLRLLLVVDSLDFGGAERHVVDLAVALRQKGHEVVVACSVGGGLSGPLQESGIPVRALLDRLVKRRFSLALARKLRKLIKVGRFDLVHAHVYASASAAAVATLGLDVPLVITEHSEGSWHSKAHSGEIRHICSAHPHSLALFEHLISLLACQRRRVRSFASNRQHRNSHDLILQGAESKRSSITRFSYDFADASPRIGPG